MMKRYHEALLSKILVPNFERSGQRYYLPAFAEFLTDMIVSLSIVWYLLIALYFEVSKSNAIQFGWNCLLACVPRKIGQHSTLNDFLTFKFKYEMRNITIFWELQNSVTQQRWTFHWRTYRFILTKILWRKTNNKTLHVTQISSWGYLNTRHQWSLVKKAYCNEISVIY